MLSAMTTSENFPLADRSGCSRYGSHVQVGPREDESVIGGRRLLQGPARRPEQQPSPLLFRRLSPGPEDSNGAFAKDVPESDFLEDQLDMEDPSPFDHSKPLKIDLNVLKLDFSKLTSQVKANGRSDDACLSDLFFKAKRSSCHLSGGGLLTSAVGFDLESVSNQFSNRISPSSPLAFDSSENTNPFKNLSSSEEKLFHATNPFADSNSSLNPGAVPPEYENILAPKSFSRCSTRSASPAGKPPDDPFIPSNPFLTKETSSPVSRFPPNAPSSHSPSFILAVPVFSIFHPDITNSSTQTTDTHTEERVYQNVSSRLSKFSRRSDHSEHDLQCLESTIQHLRTSGWYYENVTWQESVALLSDTEPGTFLIRDSSDPDFLFSLSVQTSRGPTSVRIHYVRGRFRLDAEKNLIPHMPSFDSVIELVDYYVESTVKNKSNARANAQKRASKRGLQKSKDQVWIDAQGNVYSNILLVRPLRKKDHFSSLQHLSRLAINSLLRKRSNAKVKFDFKVTPVYESSPFQESSFPSHFDDFCPILNVDSLPLSPKLLRYLKEYPYCH